MEAKTGSDATALDGFDKLNTKEQAETKAAFADAAAPAKNKLKTGKDSCEPANKKLKTGKDDGYGSGKDFCKYSFELNHQGRAACKGGSVLLCGEKIPKGTVRMGHQEGNEDPRFGLKWYCLKCVSEEQVKIMKIKLGKDLARAEGFTELPEKEQSLVKETLKW